MNDQNKTSAGIFLLAPFVFVCHVLEEAPHFVAWANTHVTLDITQQDFERVNLSGLTITIIVVALIWLVRSRICMIAGLAWLSFLMLANAFVHIAGAFVDGGYVPGVATAVFLYIPYYFWLVARLVKNGEIQIMTWAGAALFGAIPMLLHGYLILFRGSRLF